MQIIVIAVLEKAKVIRDIDSTGFHVRMSDDKMDLWEYSVYIRITKLGRLNLQLIIWTPRYVIGFAFSKQFHKMQVCLCSSERSTSDEQG